jgi:hypothetical protein
VPREPFPAFFLKQAINIPQQQPKYSTRGDNLKHRYAMTPDLRAIRQSRNVRDEKTNRPNSHGEGIDILVKSIQQKDCLNHHVVDTIHIELHLGSAVAMPQAKLGLFQVGLLQSTTDITKKLGITMLRATTNV